MFVTETDVFRRVPSPKDLSVKAFQGYMITKGLSILILQGAGSQNDRGKALFGQVSLSPARSLRLHVMLFQGFLPRTIKNSAATRITPKRIYITSVMDRFLLHERFAISV
jgi:hypothetical protein